MPRTSKSKKDQNQNSLISQIKALGHSAHATHMVKDGFPDIVTGYQGFNFLVEIKNPDQTKSSRSLTKMEEFFHDGWRGNVMIVETIKDYVSNVNAFLIAKGFARLTIKFAA